jgi:hypothetical protein
VFPGVFKVKNVTVLSLFKGCFILSLFFGQWMCFLKVEQFLEGMPVPYSSLIPEVSVLPEPWGIYWEEFKKRTFAQEICF